MVVLLEVQSSPRSNTAIPDDLHSTWELLILIHVCVETSHTPRSARSDQRKVNYKPAPVAQYWYPYHWCRLWREISLRNVVTLFHFILFFPSQGACFCTYTLTAASRATASWSRAEDRIRIDPETQEHHKYVVSRLLNSEFNVSEQRAGCGNVDSSLIAMSRNLNYKKKKTFDVWSRSITEIQAVSRHGRGQPKSNMEGGSAVKKASKCVQGSMACSCSCLATVLVQQFCAAATTARLRFPRPKLETRGSLSYIDETKSSL